MSGFDELARHASLLQRATYIAAAVRHRYSRASQHDPTSLELELAAKTLLLCTELEIAQHRLREMYLAIELALRELGAANPERSSDIRAIEGTERSLRTVYDREATPVHRVRVGMDGSVHHAPWAPDSPFAAATATGLRTRICAHCGRACGDMAGGWSLINNQPFCHPNEPGRPDCYRMAQHGHPLYDCDTCTTFQTDPIDDRTMP